MARTIEELLNAKPFIAVHQEGGPAVLVNHAEAMTLLQAGAELIGWDQHSTPEGEPYRFEWYRYREVKFLWLEHYFAGLRNDRILEGYPGAHVNPLHRQAPA